jgi:PAS domain-containing protein
MTTPTPPADSTPARDLVTASAGVFATAVVLALLTRWSDTVNGAVFVLTAAAIAWQGGFRRGVYASVLASVALWLLVVLFDPVGAARAPLRTLTLLLSCLAVSWLCGNIHAARRQVALEQRRLRESEQFHRVIAELAADFAFHGRFVSDTEVTIDGCTPGLPMLIGYEIADLERQSWMGRVHPEDRPRLDGAIAKVRLGHAVTDTCRLRARDGRTVFTRAPRQQLELNHVESVQSHYPIRTSREGKATKTQVQRYPDHARAWQRWPRHARVD